MNSYLIIAKKELKDILRSKIFIFILSLFLLLVTISVVVSSLVFADQLAQYLSSFEILKSLWKTITETKPELHPLSLLRGVVDYVEIVWAILWIFLWYISAYREKTSKALSLLLSRPIKKSQIIYGKLLGNIWFILILMIFVSILISVLLTFVAWASLWLVEYIRMLLFIIISTVYITIFFLLSFLLSLSGKNIVNSLIFAFLIWLVFALIIPQIGDTMDTDNQVQWWFFKSLNLSRDDEFKVMDHFKTYEIIRTWTEQLSITKHYERLEFALFWVKSIFQWKSLWYIVKDRYLDIILLLVFLSFLIYLNIYLLERKLRI